MHLIVFLIIGGIAGAVAWRLMSGHGYGIVVDVILGIVGSFVGGLIVSTLFGITGGGLIASFIIALIGACIVVGILHLVTARRLRTY